MQRIHAPLRLLVAALLLAAAVSPFGYNAQVSQANTINQDSSSNISLPPPVAEPEGFLYYEENGEVQCRTATDDQARVMASRDPLELEVISPEGVSIQEGGDLNIVLRATSQLNNFPQAREVFLRAAELWKARIQAPFPITVIIDVDFGPTFFGQAYDSSVIGGTTSQRIVFPSAYPALRSALIARASDAHEASLYNGLPTSSVPTDIGAAVNFESASALARAIGLLNPIANPEAEQAQIGTPPAIGFNSGFTFDFDPTNGIDADKIDFEAVAVHELGHALGFNSRVGEKERVPSSTLAFTILDLFRFRPGTTMGTFASAQRVLSSGGEQVFFAGASDLGLSTARSDRIGGDGNQASHWKDSSFLGFTIGIMDPKIARGERVVISENDVAAMNTFGYMAKSGPVNEGDSPTIGSVAGSLSGDVLTMTGSVSDGQGDIAQAQLTLLNSQGNTVAQSAAVGVNLAGATSTSFTLQFNGLNVYPTATRASLIFIDARGNRSSGATADFGQADAGGPKVTKVSYSGSKLTIKGNGLTGQLQLEINGVVVASVNNSSNKKLKVSGNSSKLNITSGPNRVRVIKNNLRSNIAVPTL
jgi:hypothetical protein